MKNKLKTIARRAINNLIQSGKLIRPNCCSRCEIACSPHAHHPDYSNPFAIEWVCRKCHDKIHYQVRYDLVQSRRKYFDPCACGKKAICRSLCKTCYSRWRDSIMPTCVVENCKNNSRRRGLCSTHLDRFNRDIFKKYAMPKKRPGPQVNYQPVA